MRTEKKNQGFTLVELLIVIVILGILATVTVFAVTGITSRGKTSACDADKKTLQVAEEAYSANTGHYSVSDDATVTPMLFTGQQELVTAGLLHAVSQNFTIKVTPGTAPAVDTYKLTGVPTSDCTGMTG